MGGFGRAFVACDEVFERAEYAVAAGDGSGFAVCAGAIVFVYDVSVSFVQ